MTELLAFVAVVVAVAARCAVTKPSHGPSKAPGGPSQPRTGPDATLASPTPRSGPHRGAQRRTAIPARHTPAWAHTQPADKEHA